MKQQALPWMFCRHDELVSECPKCCHGPRPGTVLARAVDAGKAVRTAAPLQASVLATGIQASINLMACQIVEMAESGDPGVPGLSSTVQDLLAIAGSLEEDHDQTER